QSPPAVPAPHAPRLSGANPSPSPSMSVEIHPANGSHVSIVHGFESSQLRSGGFVHVWLTPQVSAPVQTLPSSQSSSDSQVHRQLDSHPSLSTTLPSSHCSPAASSTNPSPHCVMTHDAARQICSGPQAVPSGRALQSTS